jgi:hypothetical protein
MDNALSGILAKPEVKILKVLESINLSVLSSLKRVVGMENSALDVTGMADGAVLYIQPHKLLWPISCRSARRLALCAMVSCSET